MKDLPKVTKPELDLVGHHHHHHNPVQVSLYEDENGAITMKGLSMHIANNEVGRVSCSALPRETEFCAQEEALNLLFLGDTNRAIR